VWGEEKFPHIRRTKNQKAATCGQKADIHSVHLVKGPLSKGTVRRGVGVGEIGTRWEGSGAEGEGKKMAEPAGNSLAGPKYVNVAQEPQKRCGEKNDPLGRPVYPVRTKEFPSLPSEKELTSRCNIRPKGRTEKKTG